MQKVCVQTAVYWGNPVENGYGKKTYDSPVEIYCRVELKTQTIKTSDGTEKVSKSELLVLQDLDIGGILYIGLLSSLSSLGSQDLLILDELGVSIKDEELEGIYAEGNTSSPYSITGVYEILAFDKIPLFMSSTEFVRKAYLWKF